MTLQLGHLPFSIGEVALAGEGWQKLLGHPKAGRKMGQSEHQAEGEPNLKDPTFRACSRTVLHLSHAIICITIWGVGTSAWLNFHRLLMFANFFPITFISMRPVTEISPRSESL
jgi:hypothetical protein